MHTKQQIREKMLQQRKMYVLDQKRHDDIIITRTLLSLDIIEKARSICIYVSKQDEIDTLSFIKQKLKDSHSMIIVPKVKDSILQFFRIIDLKYLKESSFGVFEPDDNCQQVSLNYCDVFITPGLVFSLDGYRIGYGKGYYDHVFTLSNKPRIALAYDFQVLETVPHEAYDKQVDLVVTPTRIINCTKKVKL